MLRPVLRNSRMGRCVAGQGRYRPCPRAFSNCARQLQLAYQSAPQRRASDRHNRGIPVAVGRSEEHTSELQSLMRISYAVFCLKKKNKKEAQIKRQQTENKITH